METAEEVCSRENRNNNVNSGSRTIMTEAKKCLIQFLLSAIAVATKERMQCEA